MPKLTRRVIDALESGLTEQFTWDNELRGFGVRLKPTGAGSYIVQYRNAEGRSRRLTLGSIKVLTVDEARDLARNHLAEVRKGEDPAEQRKALRSAATVAEICEWYLEEAEAGRLLGRKNRPIAKSTLALDRSRIDQHVKPLIGARAVRGLTIRDLEQFQSDIMEGKTAKERKGRGGATTGGAGVAGRTLGMLRTIFEQATRLSLVEANPAVGARKIQTDVKRDHKLRPDQIKALGQVLRNREQESPVAVAAIRTLLLTGFRKNEALGLKRDWIDEGLGGVAFPSTKSGPQMRPVGKAALDYLLAQPKTKSGFTFPGDSGSGHFIGIARVLQRFAVEAKIEHLTPHVLRHTFGTMAGELGFSELVVGALLGHASRGVTQRYVHIDRATKFAADEVSIAIQALL